MVMAVQTHLFWNAAKLEPKEKLGLYSQECDMNIPYMLCAIKTGFDHLALI